MKPGEGMATLGWAILGVIVINAGFAFFRNIKRSARCTPSIASSLPGHGCCEATNRMTYHGMRSCRETCS